jgi:uncharacterized membrane protein
MHNQKNIEIFYVLVFPISKHMSSKTINLLSILAAFGMIAAGITALYDEDLLFTGIGIYFISKGFFVISLMQKMQNKSNRNCCSNNTKS